MKTARLLIVLLNFAIIGILVFAGISFYVKSEFFKEPAWESIDAPPKRTSKDVRRGKSLTEYTRALEQLAMRQKKEIIVPPPTEPVVPTLQVEIKAVSYNKDYPEQAGAHIMAKGVARYLEVGDDQPISSDMHYYLKEITEDKPGTEWTLFFEDDKGNRSQKRYVKK
jgi:hypothetical protein